MRVLILTLIATLSHAQEGRWLTVIATAYCPCALCCDVRTERTANGTNTNRVPYGVAASPNLPLGSRVWIPAEVGYLSESRASERWFPIDDRGGALRSDWRRNGITRLDLRFKTHWSALQFGRRMITVYIEAP